MVLALYGAGGFGKETFDMVSIHMKDKWEEVIFIDDVKPVSEFHGTRVLPYKQFMEIYSPQNAEIVITQGTPSNKKLIYDRIKADGFIMPKLIHPNAYVADDAILDEGVIVFVGTTISSTTRIGKCSAVLTYSLVGHDTHIGDFCQISAMVLINGNANIGDESFVGGGARIREKISIGNNSIVAMGACVMKDVQDGVLVMGNPARVIKNSEEVTLF